MKTGDLTGAGNTVFSELKTVITTMILTV